MDPTQTFRPLDSAPHTAPRRKRNKAGRGKLRRSDPLWVGKVEGETLYRVNSDEPVWMTNAQQQQPSTPLTISTPSHLTPDWFQQPVKLLNSIEQALKNPSEYSEVAPAASHLLAIHSSHMTASTSHMTAPTSHMAAPTSHMTAPTSHMTAHTSHMTAPTSHMTAPTSHMTASTSHMTAPTSHMTAPTSHMMSADGHMISPRDFVSPKPPPSKRRRSSTSNGPPLDDSGEIF